MLWPIWIDLLFITLTCKLVVRVWKEPLLNQANFKVKSNKFVEFVLKTSSHGWTIIQELNLKDRKSLLALALPEVSKCLN